MKLNYIVEKEIWHINRSYNYKGVYNYTFYNFILHATTAATTTTNFYFTPKTLCVHRT